MAWYLFLFLNFFLPAVVYAAIFYYYMRGERRFALHLLLSLVVAWGLGYVIKSLFYFPRPYISLGITPLFTHPLDGSFPSNHTSSTFAVASGVFRRHKRLGFNLLIISSLVAATRVAYHFHSWTDIAGGLVLALLVEHVIYRILPH